MRYNDHDLIETFRRAYHQPPPVSDGVVQIILGVFYGVALTCLFVYAPAIVRSVIHWLRP